MNFYFINSNLVYSFGSLSLKLEQGSRVVHFTVLAPMTFIVVLNSQMQNSKLRPSKLIIKSNAQNKSYNGFRHKLHDLNYFELYFHFIFLTLIINLRSSSDIFVKNHQFNAKVKQKMQNQKGSNPQRHTESKPNTCARHA